MIYLLLGTDDFSKKECLQELENKEKLEKVELIDPSPEDLFSAGASASLFSSKRLIKAEGFFSKNDYDPEYVDKLSKSDSVFIFVEPSLDKRKTATKKLLADKNITVKEFKLPLGDNLKKWVISRCEKLGLKFGAGALDVFLQRIGAYGSEQSGEIYSLWQVDHELNKLVSFAQGKAVSTEDVKALVAENLEENVFRITNAIGDKNRALALKYLQEHIDRIPGDEKAKVISISALLADQLRNILIFQDMQSAPDAEVISRTGFSPGRVFVFRKLARNIPKEKNLDALRKLEHLDEEVKTSSGPATLQFFMILEGMLR
jgi:DNA polymerase III subunit delta